MLWKYLGNRDEVLLSAPRSGHTAVGQAGKVPGRREERGALLLQEVADVLPRMMALANVALTRMALL